MVDGEPGAAGASASSEVVRRPGTTARVLLFLSVLFAYALALSVAFPPGAPDRLPVLALSVALALAAAQRWERGVVLLAFVFPCAGLIARLSGGADAAAWPTLLFAGFAAGWSFRFIYDFETQPDPSGPDRSLKGLLALWTLSTLLAVVQARTLWALFHGLAGRTVNGEGLPESTAIRESLLSFGALASGGGFFLILRRCGPAIRRRGLEAAIFGTAVSGAAALLQRLSLLPAEAHPFWRMTGRLSGGASDPNALGLLCALALVPGLAVAREKGGRLSAASAVALCGAGFLLSGSRSGLLVILGSLALLVILRRKARSLRALGLAAAGAAILFFAVLMFSASPGTVGARIARTFDSARPVAARASSRPILWSAAWRFFREHPVEGGGMGVFSWRLPDLLRAQGARLPARDNPGSAYFQALAETGVLGLALTLFFAAAIGRDGLRRVAEEGGNVSGAAALAALSFLGALAVGSHWLAADTSLLFFLVASVAARPAADGRSWPPRSWLLAAVLLYAAAALAGALATARPEETFRYGSRIGFYPPEVGPGGAFRWTRQNFALWLEPGESVRLGLAHFSPLGRPVEITASQDGRLVYRRTLEPGAIVTLRLSGGAARPEALRFALSRSFVPRRLGIPGGDARELGLQAVFLDP